MTSALTHLLTKYRQGAKSEREKGTYFENLTKVYLENDALQKSQYNQVWMFKDWAALQGVDGKDVGIDLVAKLADDEGFCAIQCKFYDEKHRIAKADIDSFFTASGRSPFMRRLIIDTTRAPWSKNAEEALIGQNIPVSRISLDELEKSNIDWSQYAQFQKIVLQGKKDLRDHQKDALKATQEGFQTADRGKLIMACGTGKTFTSLRIAESIAGKGKRVLYLVPSLALMSQTVREWSNDTELDLFSFAVCSDVQVGIRKGGEDETDLNIHDLAFPATTDASKLGARLSEWTQEEEASNRMTVVFATYQSIQVISDAQKKYGMPEFDLIVCDEAHRTTGATLPGEEDNKSNFVKVHDQKTIQSKKRLYMTATPRIYGDAVKSKAQESGVVLCAMDDESLYGQSFYEISFSEAVQRELLTDYKVIVLAVDETAISASMQKRFADENFELKLDDVTKIIGCYKALTKTDFRAELLADPNPMKRAVAFCKSIKVSEQISREFTAVVEEYLKELGGDPEAFLHCQMHHVDGTFNTKDRNTELDWLKNVEDPNTCHILSNVRCLSEGVDVPALDAIMFLHPRNSQVDVVQSVGRVMRRAPGKSLGYVILPIGIPADMSPDEALNNNEKYKVVWQILNALRAHDDRFDNYMNRIDLNQDISSKMEIVAVSNTLPNRKNAEAEASGIGGSSGGEVDEETHTGNSRPVSVPGPAQTAFVFDDLQKAILAKIVKKCGTREYWEDWANDIAKIAQQHIVRITGVLDNPESKGRKAFDEFLEEIRDDLNESITREDAIEMLAQHLITRPVFEALFEGYSFALNNPVSVSMQKVLDVLDEHNIEKEAETLQKFYDSVRRKAAGIEGSEAKQRIIVKLYDQFFRNAFPRLTEKLGIVYTPVEIVDFIIHSVNDVLQQEFGQTLGSRGVHILDPFVGTGTFITRLMQSGLIKSEELPYKYANEIHANEIVLLAYYIAAINIEQVYHSLLPGDYVPFEGICLTDTFQLYEKDDLISGMMEVNSTRRKRQKDLDIRVIVGNPPYSNAANIVYPTLDENISKSYVLNSKQQGGKRSMYDSYIRAIRWGSELIGDSGIMAYVSGNAWIERTFGDGMRKCLREEFTNLYVLNLRGDIRKNILSKGKAGEGGNIFGSGSMTGIAITIFVKNPYANEHGKIYYYDIGDNVSQLDKLKFIKDVKSIKGIDHSEKGWTEVIPDSYNDWLGQREQSFDKFIVLANKDNQDPLKLFEVSSNGVVSSRDTWVINFSQNSLEQNMTKFISEYNNEVERYQISDKSLSPKDFVNNDPTKFNWGINLLSSLKKGNKKTLDISNVTQYLYRPFLKTWIVADKNFNHSLYSMPKIFPNNDVVNKAISISGTGARSGFTVLMVQNLCDIQFTDNGLSFPLKLYEKIKDESSPLFGATGEGQVYEVRDGITNDGLEHFQAAYPEWDISKEDIFYYVYGLLHSEEYRERYADNLSKQLPRIPLMKRYEDFAAFSQAGRKLGDLHVGYESVEPYPVNFSNELFMKDYKSEDYRVEQMKFAGKRPNVDKTTIIYNHKITMSGIPQEAYKYVVNGKPALEWVMERQCVKIDKDSGIVNDANRYAIETMEDPAYPLKLFQRVITVSLETMKLVHALPKLDIREG
ncbi:MAG: DEAD/DEAH box helicase [Sphingobacteriales bacterium]|nr:MAG: DEAD/DEAH box helicase [Sphingobacteriales bacterium]